MQNKFEMDSSSSDYQPKENVNLRLSVDISDVLEEVLFFAKKEIPRNKRRKITKSEICEIILRDFINDYQSKGRESRLWKLLMAYNQN